MHVVVWTDSNDVIHVIIVKFSTAAFYILISTMYKNSLISATLDNVIYCF